MFPARNFCTPKMLIKKTHFPLVEKPEVNKGQSNHLPQPYNTPIGVFTPASVITLSDMTPYLHMIIDLREMNIGP